MTSPDFTEEQIAAAQLRLVLDRKLGRDTPDIVHQIAAHAPADDVNSQTTDSAEATKQPADERRPSIKLLGPVTLEPSPDRSTFVVRFVGRSGTIEPAGEAGPAGSPRTPSHSIDPKTGTTALPYREDLRTFESAGDAQTEAAAAARRGASLAGQRRYEDALDSYTQAIELAVKTGDLSTQATALSGVGAVFSQLGQHEDALQCLERAVELLHSLEAAKNANEA